MNTSSPINRKPLDFPVDYIHGFFAQTIRLFFRLSGQLSIVRHGPMPPGGFVLACNHRSFLDPLAVGCTLRRRIHYFARSSLWKILPIRWTLDLFGGIPVDRDKPQTSTMTHTIGVLREGRSLLMFPEGTRTKTGRMGRFRDGPALVARRAKVPVIPVYLVNTEGSWPRGAWLPKVGRGKVKVIFGPAMMTNTDLPSRAQDTDLSARIENWLRSTEERFMGPAKASVTP